MALQKTSIIICLFLEAQANTFFHSVKYNGTEDWSTIRHIQASVPLVVKVNNSLVHVLDSLNLQCALRIESGNSPAACNIQISLAYPLRYPRHAVSLGNGKLVIWLLNYSFERQKHVGAWHLAVIEPRDCSYREFVVPDSDTAPIDILDVVGYHDTFDVFVTESGHDPPRGLRVYRYSDEAEPLPIADSSLIVDEDSFYNFNTIKLHPLKAYDPSEGYFYISINRELLTIVVKRLDKNLQRLSHVELDHVSFHEVGSDAYSTSHGQLTVCGTSDSRRHYLRCSWLDASLKEVRGITLAYPSFEDYFSDVARVAVRNLPDGGLLLVFALRVIRRAGTPLYVQRIGVDGITSEPRLIGNIRCDLRSLRSFEMRDNVYCVAAICDERVHTRCIQVRKSSAKK